MKTILPIFWLVNILVFLKHNLNNLFIKFHHVISVHGQCWSTTGHAAMLVNMLTTRKKSLNFYLISFNSRVSYHFPYNIPFQGYAGELAFVDMFIHSCRFESESLGDRLPDTRGYSFTIAMGIVIFHFIEWKYILQITGWTYTMTV